MTYLYFLARNVDNSILNSVYIFSILDFSIKRNQYLQEEINDILYYSIIDKVQNNQLSFLRK